MVIPNAKRESDPVMMDDKLKEMVRRGIVGHHLNARAQSLDISRQIEAFGRGSPSRIDESGEDQVASTLSQLRL
jgi:hypothetical protein